DFHVTGVQTCALPILGRQPAAARAILRLAKGRGPRIVSGGALELRNLAKEHSPNRRTPCGLRMKPASVRIVGLGPRSHWSGRTQIGRASGSERGEVEG